MKVLILLLAKNASPWNEIEKNGQEATWRSVYEPSVSILRYVGNEQETSGSSKLIELYWRFQDHLTSVYPRAENIFANSLTKLMNQKFNHNTPKVVRIGDTLQIDENDRYHLIGLKTIAAFKYCLSMLEFDFLYRTNISSYVNQSRLYKFASQLPAGHVYAGIHTSVNQTPFASGSGYFLSRSLLEQVIERSVNWNHSKIDDVALGALISTISSVKRINTRRIDIHSLDQLANFRRNELESSFHYRCKSANERVTIQIMRKLFELGL